MSPRSTAMSSVASVPAMLLVAINVSRDLDTFQGSMAQVLLYVQNDRLECSSMHAC